MSARRLEGKVALVTGASSGLGRAIALAFAEQGTKFILCADLHDAPPAGETTSTVDLIEQRHGRRTAGFYKGDVGEAEHVANAVSWAVSLGGGRLDMTVNLRSVFLGCKYACAQFLIQKPHLSGDSGWIINTSSGAGLRPVAGGASTLPPCLPCDKAAVVQFTKAVALDYAPHKIHCNAICPGYLKTPMTKHMHENKETAAQMINQTPWGSLTTVEDVAKTVIFLASDDAAGVTGVPLAVDVETQPLSHELKAFGVALEALGHGFSTQEESLVRFSNESIRLNMTNSANARKIVRGSSKSTTIILDCAEDYQRISINIEDPTRPLEWSHVLMGCVRESFPARRRTLCRTFMQ
ncbi:MAG: hypothetical protein OHK93_006341 [Ramalina farinacea]|uniref:Uncharacterized protein n=1 Tax=Ramalina farinacea TaxID=258253 RepID=A0AA43QIC6_9LECA|nr:hypothetical protein [Ramalina farinacea]